MCPRVCNFLGRSRKEKSSLTRTPARTQCSTPVRDPHSLPLSSPYLLLQWCVSRSVPVFLRYSVPSSNPHPHCTPIPQALERAAAAGMLAVAAQPEVVVRRDALEAFEEYEPDSDSDDPTRDPTFGPNARLQRANSKLTAREVHTGIRRVPDIRRLQHRVLKQLLAVRGSEFFTAPVVTYYDRERALHYLNEIQQPMDLGTLGYNIDQGLYPTMEQFYQAAALPFENGVEYLTKHPESNPDPAFSERVVESAVRLLDMLERVKGNKVYLTPTNPRASPAPPPPPPPPCVAARAAMASAAANMCQTLAARNAGIHKPARSAPARALAIPGFSPDMVQSLLAQAEEEAKASPEYAALRAVQKNIACELAVAAVKASFQ